MAKYADITPFYEWLDFLEKESNTSNPEYLTMHCYEIRDKLDDLPEIVRCKDCEHWKVHPINGRLTLGKCMKLSRVMDDKSFCSFGKKRDGEC